MTNSLKNENRDLFRRVLAFILVVCIIALGVVAIASMAGCKSDLPDDYIVEPMEPLPPEFFRIRADETNPPSTHQTTSIWFLVTNAVKSEVVD